MVEKSKAGLQLPDLSRVISDLHGQGKLRLTVNWREMLYANVALTGSLGGDNPVQVLALSSLTNEVASGEWPALSVFDSIHEVKLRMSDRRVCKITHDEVLIGVGDGVLYTLDFNDKNEDKEGEKLISQAFHLLKALSMNFPSFIDVRAQLMSRLIDSIFDRSGVPRWTEDEVRSLGRSIEDSKYTSLRPSGDLVDGQRKFFRVKYKTGSDLDGVETPYVEVGLAIGSNGEGPHLAIAYFDEMSYGITPSKIRGHIKLFKQQSDETNETNGFLVVVESPNGDINKFSLTREDYEELIETGTLLPYLLYRADIGVDENVHSPADYIEAVRTIEEMDWEQLELWRKLRGIIASDDLFTTGSNSFKVEEFIPGNGGQSVRVRYKPNRLEIEFGARRIIFTKEGEEGLYELIISPDISLSYYVYLNESQIPKIVESLKSILELVVKNKGKLSNISDEVALSVEELIMRGWEEYSRHNAVSLFSLRMNVLRYGCSNCTRETIIADSQGEFFDSLVRHMSLPHREGEPPIMLEVYVSKYRGIVDPMGPTAVNRDPSTAEKLKIIKGPDTITLDFRSGNIELELSRGTDDTSGINNNNNKRDVLILKNDPRMHGILKLIDYVLFYFALGKPNEVLKAIQSIKEKVQQQNENG